MIRKINNFIVHFDVNVVFARHFRAQFELKLPVFGPPYI